MTTGRIQSRLEIPFLIQSRHQSHPIPWSPTNKQDRAPAQTCTQIHGRTSTYACTFVATASYRIMYFIFVRLLCVRSGILSVNLTKQQRLRKSQLCRRIVRCNIVTEHLTKLTLTFSVDLELICNFNHFAQFKNMTEKLFIRTRLPDPATTSNSSSRDPVD